MNIFQIDPSNRKQVRAFIDLPERIYRDIPQWVPPLAGEERRRLNQKKYPFYRHSAAAFFLAQDGGLPIGRLAVLDNRLSNEFNHTRTASFYLFECRPSLPAVLGLFDSACAWARQRGLDKLVGPKGFTPLDGLGLLVKGFQQRPALGQPYNPDYYPQFFEEAGFKKTGEIVSGYMAADLAFPQRIHELANRIRERRGLQIVRFRSRREMLRSLGSLESLFNRIMGENNDGTPITHAEFRALADQLLWFADPHLVKILTKDKVPVGFLLAYPDISGALQKTKGRLFPLGWLTLLREAGKTDWININGAGLIEEYRGLGGTAILYSEMFKSVTEKPRYRHAEVVQIGTENDRMQREMQNFGVEFYKTHCLYERVL